MYAVLICFCRYAFGYQHICTHTQHMPCMRAYAMHACAFMHICNLILQMLMVSLLGAGSDGVIAFADDGCDNGFCLRVAYPRWCWQECTAQAEIIRSMILETAYPVAYTSKLSIHIVQVLCTRKAVVGFVQLLHVTLDAMLVNQGTLWPCLGLDRVAFLNPDHGHQQIPHIPPPLNPKPLNMEVPAWIGTHALAPRPQHFASRQ